MIKRIIIGVVLLGAVAGITVAGLRPRPPKATSVDVTAASRASITRTVTAAGKVASSTTVKINSNVTGDLIELNVKVGDPVHPGQVLGRVDPTRYKAQVKSDQAAQRAAEADVGVQKVQLAHDQAELARVQGLVDKGMSSAAELEQQKSVVAGDGAKLAASQQRADQAKGQLDASRDALNKCTLTSPTEGQVIELDRQLGERVRGSDLSEDVVMVLATLSKMEVQVEVGEHEVVFLHVGDPAKIQLDALEGKTFDGTVTEIGQNAIIRNAGTEAEVVSFPIKVALSARPPRSLPGMNATVRVATATHDNALVLPIQAVTVRPEKVLAKLKGASETSLEVADPSSATSDFAKVVFVVQDGKAKLRRVKTGLSSENDVEILGGLKQGEQVVSGPYRTIAKELKDGDAVKANASAAAQGT